MYYTTSQIAQITQAKPFGSSRNYIIKEASFDSRKVSDAEHSIFFCFKGVRNNGHQFIFNLYQRGVRAFVVSEHIETDLYPNAVFLRVENVLYALQIWAVWHRQKYDVPVVGITGSNGKTIVKEWLNTLLIDDKNVAKSPASYNSQIGVALSILLLNEQNEIGLFEAGISTRNEMALLERMIRPSIVIFTNIGDAHSEGFDSIDEKINEKLQLAKSAEMLIYCSSYNSISEAISKNNFASKAKSWGNKSSDYLYITSRVKDFNSTSIVAIVEGKTKEIRIPFTDEALVENACHCWVTMLLLGYENRIIQERILQLQALSMRLEIKEGIYNSVLVNDVYNSDLQSIKIALDFLEQQKLHDKKVVFITDVLEANNDKKSMYDSIFKMLIHAQTHTLITIGNEIKWYAESYESQFVKHFHYDDVQQCLRYFNLSEIQYSSVLLKGARKFMLEQLTNILEKKSHKTRFEINLNHVVHNLHYYHHLLQPNVKMMCMVKASSYGSGNVEIAKLLEFHKIDYLAVAYIDEAIELRNAGIKTPIMTMNTDEEALSQIMRYNIEPEIFSHRLFDKLVHTFPHEILHAKKIPIHLKIDTGMHRLGFDENEIATLIEKLIKYKDVIQVKSIFTHLAASDNAIFDDFTDEQLQLFERLANNISEAIGYSPLLHALNSAGIVRHSHAQYNMVRLGLGLYGIDSSKNLNEAIKPVGKFITVISQIKQIKAGDTIGYDRKGKVDEHKRIATISVGYADGLPRSASNGRWSVLVNNQLAPIIGNVSMDMTMIDVTHIEGVFEGQEVEIFGENLSVELLAKVCHTISYEILTGISQRVKRVFYQE